jgi:hypothetical protein
LKGCTVDGRRHGRLRGRNGTRNVVEGRGTAGQQKSGRRLKVVAGQCDDDILGRPPTILCLLSQRQGRKMKKFRIMGWEFTAVSLEGARVGGILCASRQAYICPAPNKFSNVRCCLCMIGKGRTSRQIASKPYRGESGCDFYRVLRVVFSTVAYCSCAILHHARCWVKLVLWPSLLDPGAAPAYELVDRPTRATRTPGGRYLALEIFLAIRCILRALTE